MKIYERAKKEVEPEWYWECMKGAEETLRQHGGDDCDQAAFLMALCRASGYPARYVRGEIELYPDGGRAKDLTGIPFGWVTGWVHFFLIGSPPRF